MIRLGLIGLGKMGKTFLNETKKIKSFKVTKVLKKQKKKIKNIKVFTNKNLFFSKKNMSDMDAFIITTPAISHFFYLKKIIKTNKPIIIEKPLIQNFNEYENLKAMKKKFSKKKILVNHSDLYSSGFLNINTYLKIIGPIKEVVMKFGKYQRKYQNESPYFDWLPHPIAIYCYLFGKPSKVKIKKNEVFEKNNYKFQDLHFLLERKNIKAKIHFSNNFKKPFRVVKIIGAKGSIVYNGYSKNHLFFLKNNKRININGNIKKTPIRNLLDKFSDIILEKNKFKNDIMLSFNVMETLFKIQRKLLN